MKYSGSMALYIPSPHSLGTLTDKGVSPKNTLVRAATVRLLTTID
jgi:hypothetical protein